ncbi:unnamed protein product [Paramecium primaurelia]|uniref:Uncharacterized protein n=1 Tax=Paramecium primaurelia TaxID=5886 RepID=A0A8S1JUF5_PARPR|nr:unnamed protein product [Paramecium primaurelia]
MMIQKKQFIFNQYELYDNYIIIKKEYKQKSIIREYCAAVKGISWCPQLQKYTYKLRWIKLQNYQILECTYWHLFQKAQAQGSHVWTLYSLLRYRVWISSF